MAVTKTPGEIKKHGGGIIKVLEITPTGPAGTELAAAWLELGYIQESNRNDDTTVEDIPDETGNTVASEEDIRTVKLTGLLMQSGAEIQEFLKETVRGKYYSVYHYNGLVNSKYQETIYGICRIRPMIELATGTKRIPFEITVLKNESALGYGDISEAELPTEAHATTVDIAVGTYYKIIDTAV